MLNEYIYEIIGARNLDGDNACGKLSRIPPHAYDNFTELRDNLASSCIEFTNNPTSIYIHYYMLTVGQILWGNFACHGCFSASET